MREGERGERKMIRLENRRSNETAILLKMRRLKIYVDEAVIKEWREEMHFNRRNNFSSGKICKKLRLLKRNGSGGREF